MPSFARPLRPLLLTATFACAAMSSAIVDARPEGPPRPPPEALQACEGKQAGESCSFPGREGEELAGTCFTPGADKPLACRPAHAPPPPPRD